MSSMRKNRTLWPQTWLSQWSRIALLSFGHRPWSTSATTHWIRGWTTRSYFSVKLTKYSKELAISKGHMILIKGLMEALSKHSCTPSTPLMTLTCSTLLDSPTAQPSLIYTAGSLNILTSWSSMRWLPTTWSVLWISSISVSTSSDWCMLNRLE